MRGADHKVVVRVFHIIGPPIGWADRRGGAVGVMLDDILAGVVAGLCVLVFATIAHWVLL